MDQPAADTPPPQEDRLLPLLASDIVGRAVGLWWRNLWLVAGVIAVVQVPLGLLSLLFLNQVADTFDGLTLGKVPTEEDLAALFSAAPLFVLFASGSVFGALVLQAAIIPTAAALHLGAETSALDVYRRAFGRVLPLLGAYLLIVVLLISALFISAVAAVVVAAVLFTLAEGADGGGVRIGALAMLWGGMLAAICGAVYASVRLAFFSQYVLLDRAGPWRSLAASWGLVSGSWWRVLGILILLLLVTIVLSIPVQVLGAVLQGPFLRDPAQSPADMMSSRWGIIVVMGILSAIIGAIVTIGAVVLFYDLRVRRGEAIQTRQGTR